MKNNLVEAALSYATKGYHVFPCKPHSKKPATPNGFKDATRSEKDIRRWWRENPDYNIGIRTGPSSGLLVLDVDGDEGERTVKDCGTLPGSVTVKTGKGWHHWFTYPERGLRNSAGTLGRGLDIRGDGGYVLAPPSIHPSGDAYEWAMSLDDASLAECPDWLTEKLSGPYKRPRVDVDATIEEGSRNCELFRYGSKLRGVGLNHGQIRSALLTHNRDYCNPPLPDDEVEQIAGSVMRYEPETEQMSSSSSPKSNDSDDILPSVRRFKDMTPLEGPRPYIVDGVLFKGFAGGIYGDGGSAKSMLMMHMGQCVASGEDWLGFDTVKTSVLYLDFELDEAEQSRRAYDVAAGMGYSEPAESFYYLSAAGYPTRPMFDHALNVCRERGIGMVIVDSLGYALEGDAEASRDVLRFFREVEGSFRREGVSLFIVDHQSKHGNYQEKTMFGSVYKTNSIRSVFQVEPGEHDDGYISLTVRHKKINFGPKLDPFGVRVTFDADKVSVDERELDTTELVGESTLNSKDRVLIALADGPLFPADIADATGLELGTVKNALTALRKNGEVENTGVKDSHGSNEVRTVSSLSPPIGDDDSGTRQDGWLSGIAS